jgi:hypothetical protein
MNMMTQALTSQQDQGREHGSVSAMSKPIVPITHETVLKQIRDSMVERIPHSRALGSEGNLFYLECETEAEEFLSLLLQPLLMVKFNACNQHRSTRWLCRYKQNGIDVVFSVTRSIDPRLEGRFVYMFERNL